MTDEDPMPPELPHYGYENGQIVPVDLPAEPAEQEQAERHDFEEKLGAFLRWLTDGGTVTSAGRKALLVAHLAGTTTAKDDAAFAKQIGVTKARVSQLRREIGNGYGRLARCNGRRA